MKDYIKKFWSKVNKLGPTPSHVNRIGRCWEWTGNCYGTGYGCLYVNGNKKSAHRWIYEQEVMKIPDGLLCCHKCDNKKCVRPSHLFIGTYSDNTKDCSRKGRLNSHKARQMFCHRGHPLFGDNVSISIQKTGPRRRCMECNKIKCKKYHAKKKLKKAKEDEARGHQLRHLVSHNQDPDPSLLQVRREAHVQIQDGIGDDGGD